mmetsp:Transcript_26100/g.62893  ORF Transcript_26100/g.62893 Transcript_26100/m.62893 type:complete len:189 (-) Transcript_26100:98-664(-)
MAGCKAEGYTHGVLNKSDGKDPHSILTTNGSISKFTEDLLTELKFGRYKAGGCGNKMMLLLEGKGSVYIQDRGVSRWDTCAAQAVIEACGGILSKLTTVETSRTFESYHYKVAGENKDMNEKACLTKFNAIDKSLLSQDSVPKISAENVNPQSNICGIFASKNNDKEFLKKVIDAVQKVSKTTSPQYS